MPTIISGNQTYSNASLAMNDNTSASVTGNNDTITLGNNDNLILSGSGHSIVVNGNIASHVTASNDTVTLANSAQLYLYGNTNTVAIGSNSAITITGNNSTINASGTTGTTTRLYLNGFNTVNLATSAKLTVNANSDILNVGNNATLSVIGSSNTVNAIGTTTTSHIYLSNNTINAVDNGKTAVGGNNDTINVGNSGYVGVTGNGNGIEIQSNDNLTVTGNSNTIHLGRSEIYFDATGIYYTGNNTPYTGDGSGYYLLDSSHAAIDATNVINLSGAGNTINVDDVSVGVYQSGGHTYYSDTNQEVTSGSFSFGSETDNFTSFIYTGYDGNLYLARQNSAQIYISNTNGSADTINASGIAPTTINSNAGITLANNAQLNLNGGGNLINLGNNDTLTVSSGLNGNNAIRGGTYDTITLSGYANGVEASHSTITLADYILPVGAAANALSAWDSSATILGDYNTIITNADDNVAVIFGNNNNTTVIGDNDAITYHGNYSTFTLTGINDTVTVGSGSVGTVINATSDTINLNSGSNTTTIYGDNNIITGTYGVTAINNKTDGSSVIHTWDSNDNETCVSYSGANGTGTYLGSAADPLILNLTGGAVQTQELSSSTAYFDMENNGQTVRTGWATSGEGILVYNSSNPDGAVTQHSQLVGSFAALKKLDSNTDGILNSLDSEAWQDLRIWVTDSSTTGGQLETLSQLGISAINLNATATNLDNHGNTIVAQSTFSWADGSSGEIAGVALAYASNAIGQLVGAMASFAPATAVDSSTLAPNLSTMQSQFVAIAH